MVTMATRGKTDVQQNVEAFLKLQSKNSRAWLQFSDDAEIIPKDIKGAKTLLNSNVVLCGQIDMRLRIDKCCTFGVDKGNGHQSLRFYSLKQSDSFDQCFYRYVRRTFG